MADGKILLALLWHMHQPYYKDLATGWYRLPWVRLHALKDYYGMVAMLEEFPNVRMTFNLVPSLLLQLEDYAAGTAQELVQETAFQPADELTLEQRLFLLRNLFQANVDHLIRRYPRYRELYERAESQRFQAELLLPLFQTRDYTDLQVLSQLAWSDELFLANDPEIAALVEKQQGYSLADQQLLYRKQAAFLQGILPAYRRAAERGQIEISTSPFYHPILPLLCDNYIATEAHPWVPLPRRRFRHPEDARLQLERAVVLHERLFGRTPQGVWPSEGAVSEEVLRLCASLGFRWIATDQRILTHSTSVPFHRDASGAMQNADRLYAPYRFATPGGPIDVLFRDQELSDLIGFVYSRMEAEAAAADLLRRILASAQPALARGRPALLPIILDGENAWEHFPFNGRPFLRALYRRLSAEPSIECVTVSQGLARYGEPFPLTRLAPGSWINGNFDIWIGSPEDNQAWDLLAEARDCFEAAQAQVSAEQRALAQEELLIAEGSDWCWWYGPENSTANDPDFDELYRTHLANAYRALGQRPPETLSQPIAKVRVAVISTPPDVALSPRIDGRVSSYFEWMGAGHYRPLTRATTMHGEPPALRELFFGRNAERFFLRIEFCKDPAETMKTVSLRLRIRNSSDRIRELEVSCAPDGGQSGLHCQIRSASGPPPNGPVGQAVLGKILEVEVCLPALDLPAAQPFEFQVSAWREQLPLETLPVAGWLAVPLPS
ncbi:MAG TPA: glycoside hydrolase family 57 protein [Terriglobia bacterium]|nr:glycoside hydrolase family 57 protein [Terriglobia bacterium]